MQRLRELIGAVVGDDDDEAVRDRLDEGITHAEEAGRAVRTLDAMLREPQTLVPVEGFGAVLYAIIKEETVVTVLPKAHGEEIIERGRAAEERGVAAAPAVVSTTPRRRWRGSAAPVVIERLGRGTSDEVATIAAGSPAPTPRPSRRPSGPVETALATALERARRKAAVQALREAIAEQSAESSLLPLWNALAEQGLPGELTVGDLVEAARS